ncbi:CCDC132, partial [Cordylochernes scorpioides]
MLLLDDILYKGQLIEVGEEFCESQSEDLQETIRRQTVNYFKTYHRSCLDELRMFLENESWTLCPVRYSFSIFQLQEFAFLKQLQEDKPCRDNDLASQHKSSFFPNSNPFHLPLADEELEREESLFVEQCLTNTVCSMQQEEEEDEESEGSDIPEELTKEYCGTLGDSSGRRSKGSLAIKEDPTTMPMVTNTTLNILRLFGKYLRMMSVLKPIAFDVLICLCHLYDYYMYS